jgi:DNA-binding transcriptional regulator YdaS (Cro superfamily)
LTNHQKCDIIKIQMRDARQKPARWQDPRESGKSLTIKSSTARGVGVRNTNVNQTVQAETMSRISLLPQATGAPTIERGTSLERKRTKPPVGMISAKSAPTSFSYQRLDLCPSPINGVRCQRITSFAPQVPLSCGASPLCAICTKIWAVRQGPRRTELSSKKPWALFCRCKLVYVLVRTIPITLCKLHKTRMHPRIRLGCILGSVLGRPTPIF